LGEVDTDDFSPDKASVNGGASLSTAIGAGKLLIYGGRSRYPEKGIVRLIEKTIFVRAIAQARCLAYREVAIGHLLGGIPGRGRVRAGGRLRS
jgi:hypothetical protein